MCLARPDLLSVFNIHGEDGVVSRLEGLDIDVRDGNTVVSKLKSPSNVSFSLSGGALLVCSATFVILLVRSPVGQEGQKRWGSWIL